MLRSSGWVRCVGVGISSDHGSSWWHHALGRGRSHTSSRVESRSASTSQHQLLSGHHHLQIVGNKVKGGRGHFFFLLRLFFLSLNKKMNTSVVFISETIWMMKGMTNSYMLNLQAY